MTHYVPVGWVDNTPPYIDTANLDHMEAGISAAVRSVVAGTNVTVDNTDPQNPVVAAAGGGGGAGAPVVRKFPFAHDTAGILTGAALYTPTVGDILLDAWIEVDTAWNGTTPKCDFGMFQGQNNGWMWNTFDGSVADMTLVDDSNALVDTGMLSESTATAISTELFLRGSVRTSGGLGYRVLPAKFTGTMAPIKVCVSQDGSITGANPGATQGAAILYLVTVTPV